MRRELVRKLNEEFVKIDKYLDLFEKKYGDIYYNGDEYVIGTSEEVLLADSGEKIYSGEAYRRDAIECFEHFDEAEDLDQVDIKVDLFYYERDAEQVLNLDNVGQIKWKGGYFGI